MSRAASVFAKNGMVVSSQPLATLAGVQVLARGGNAIDAAITTAAVLGVVEPMSIGIGGDAFCLFYSARDGAVSALDASGRSPYAANLDFFRDKAFKEMPQRGIHSVTVPGAVHGWQTLSNARGTMKWRDLIEPAVRYADEGFPVGELTAASWQECESRLKSDEGAAAHYLVEGRAPRAGEIFRNPRMARTLRIIAGEGAGAVYHGDIADHIVRCSESNGGLLTREDFADHASEWVNPITAHYRGHDVYELPPATQGFVALEMLKILEGFDLAASGPNSPEALHLMIEAKKLAFADRDRYLADREFMRIATADLIAPERIERLRLRVGRQGATGNACASGGTDTEYVAAADVEGNLVSFIQSNFMGFGSGIVEPETAIVLQNRGHLFSLDRHHPNCIGPHKRCMHTLMPGMIFHGGRPYAALGLKGGHVQPQVQVQIICNLLDFRMTPQESINAARFNHIDGRTVGLEAEISPAAAEELKRRGHEVMAGTPESYGGAHMIMVDRQSGAYIGASDPRKGGCALGL
jgi:gamma-glutamyltranspeptidase/glutathione hydrolase